MIAPEASPRAKRRALVLAGGGAKGVFESGALHALARIGYEPDVVTGSSVGAINAAAYAEWLRARRLEGEEVAEQRLELLLRLWQRLDRWKVADFDRWGWRVVVLATLFGLLGLALAWWAVAGDPVSPGGWWLVRVAAFLAAVLLSVAGATLATRWLLLPRQLRERVRRGMTASPELAARRQPSPSAWGRRLLRWLGLHPALFTERGLAAAVRSLVPAGRRFGDYQLAGLDLRLTRTNLRAGRTEISERVTAAQLSRPGAERGRRVLGDPLVIPAVLASAAFPLAFPPVAAERIYPPSDNPELYGIVAERAHALRALMQLFGRRAEAELIWLQTVLDGFAEEDPTLLRVGREGELYRRLKERFIGDHAPWIRVATGTLDLLVDTRHWPELPLPEFAPHGDRYFDGGVLDNTPLSSALAALRELQAMDERRDGGEAESAAPIHEMLVILLSPPPRRQHLSAAHAAALAGPALGLRALRLQAERRLAADAKMAEKVDRLLAAREEERIAARATRRAVPPAFEPVAAAPRARPDLPAGESWRDLLSRESGPSEPPLTTLDLPVREKLARVEVTRVAPTWDLPWVLSLDDRVGFRTADAEAFQARGCRDTLQGVVRGHVRHAGTGDDAPPHVQRAAALLGAGSLARPVLPGWVCRIERCLLREVCDRVAAGEAKAARELGEPAAANP